MTKLVKADEFFVREGWVSRNRKYNRVHWMPRRAGFWTLKTVSYYKPRVHMHHVARW
jgi:hypothetical protein